MPPTQTAQFFRCGWSNNDERSCACNRLRQLHAKCMNRCCCAVSLSLSTYPSSLSFAAESTDAMTSSRHWMILHLLLGRSVNGSVAAATAGTAADKLSHGLDRHSSVPACTHRRVADYRTRSLWWVPWSIVQSRLVQRSDHVR